MITSNKDIVVAYCYGDSDNSIPQQRSSCTGALLNLLTKNRILYICYCRNLYTGTMLKGNAHVALVVSDMEKSLYFYCEVLGFEKAFEQNDDEGKPGGSII
jgi:hypothetical protein